MSCGIYKITNNINQKCYIGCSKNIEHRWIAHKSESILEYNPQYNYSIHKAFRKYGIDNFSFEIVELCTESELFDKEQYYIQYYDSYNNGYNETLGGDTGPALIGENNPNAKLSEQDVINIRTRLLNGEMLNDVYQDYKNNISKRGFEHIWRGENWLNILPEAIQYVKSKEYLSKVRSYAGSKNVKIKHEDILLRKANGEQRLEVYKDYKQFYSLSGFNKIWYKK